jgi:hypothetical protein
LRRDRNRDAYERAWAQLRAAQRVHALVARLDGRVVGLTHFLFHPSTTAVAAERPWGVWGGNPPPAPAPEARARQIFQHTREDNATARRLYDAVAENRGFIQYVLPLA